MRLPVGMWRSLVAYLNGVQGVPGSNPGIPTKFPEEKSLPVPLAVPIHSSNLRRFLATRDALESLRHVHRLDD